MRRYTFYLSVALLAFGTGVGYFLLYFSQSKKNSDESLNQAKEEKANLTVHCQGKVETFNERLDNCNKAIQDEEFISDKEQMSLLFEPTINNWLNGRKINSLVEPSAEVVEKITAKKLNEIDRGVLMRSARTNYTTILIDADGDGKDELSILGDCAENGDFRGSCDFWILKRIQNDFKIILSAFPGKIDFKLQKSKTKGYFNIETFKSYSVESLKLFPNLENSMAMNIYRFDGKQYILDDCFEYEYRYKGRNGKLQNLKKPKLHSTLCD